MKHGSLFAGIGGFDLGFERAGIETIWQVEIDAYCRRVLAKHFPHAKRYADVRRVGAHNLDRVDVISGGFPCQDISNAGKRAGIDGERSGLWSEYARIIRELRPRFVVVENVAALLNRGIERVLGDLAALGYDAEWQSIRASDVGAPHRRERIWIIAYPQSDGAQGRILDARRPGITRENGNEGNLADAERRKDGGLHRGRPHETAALELAGNGADVANAERCGRRQPTGHFDCSQESFHSSERSEGALVARSSGEDVPDADGAGCGERRRTVAIQSEQPSIERIREVCDADGRRRKQWNAIKRRLPIFNPANRIERSEQWAIEPDVGRVAHGIPARVDRLRGLGNAIIPQIAEYIGRQIVGR